MKTSTLINSTNRPKAYSCYGEYGQLIIDTISGDNEVLAQHFMDKDIDSDIYKSLCTIHQRLCQLDEYNTAKLKKELPDLYAGVIEFAKMHKFMKKEF